jgi:hypothetical protein
MGQAPGLPYRLTPGSSVMLTLSYTPSELGLSNGTLTFASDSPGDEEVVVTLEGVRSDAACEVQASTAETNFGAVRVGQQMERTYSLRNTGTGACVLTSPFLSTLYANDSGFTVSGAADHIGPGEEATVSVRFAPARRGQLRAVAEVEVLGVGPVLVTLRGRGVTGGLSVNPLELDFGAVVAGCASPQKSFSLLSNGSDTASVDAPVLTAGAPFWLSSMNLPGQLAPGAAITFPVTFAPTQEGVFDADVTLTGYIPDEVTLVVALHGEGANANVPVTEHFVVDAVQTMDVLFVVDNSGSMSDNQERLAANALRFVEVADFLGTVDYHLGVTTTDVDEGGERGQLLGSPAYITRSSGNPTGLFTERAEVGVMGSGYEQGLEAARLAFSSPAVEGANQGFLRLSAGLAVVIVSDEEDSSPLLVRQYLDFFDGLKSGTRAPVVISAISGGDSGCQDTTDGDLAFPAARYMEAVRATGGIAESICESDWGESLRHVGESVFLSRGRFRLAGTPGSGSITLKVNGVSQSVGWIYDAVANAVVFDSNHLPSAGARVDITYESSC